MGNSFELSNKKYKNGRRKFKAVLYELQPPECVIGEVGTKFNKNGITFLEEFCKPQLESIKDMSVSVSFLDEDRTLICDHGFTGMTEDGMPTFDNATDVGHFTKGYIDDIKIDDKIVHCVVGEGFLDDMRYHGFIEKLESDLSEGFSVDGSIEIYRDENHDTIIYKYGYKDEGRIPQYFTHTGWSMVLSPADTNSKLIELNQKKEETKKMDEAKFIETVKSTIVETNSQNETLSVKVTELNETIAEKDAQIKKMGDEKEAEVNACAEKDKQIEELNAKIAGLEKELSACKKAEQNSALDKAIENFSVEEIKYAEVEINSFKENPEAGSVDAIVNKIYAGIGSASKKAENDARVAEQNSKKENENLDIFSEINSVKDEDLDDTNIF